MNFTHPHFPRHQFLFKGGGGDAPEIQPAPVAAPAPTPTVLQTPAPAAPPATNASAPVATAKLDAKQAAAKRKGVNSTILSSADGNALGSSASGTNTRLGGG